MAFFHAKESFEKVSPILALGFVDEFEFKLLKTPIFCQSE
jgi:hypothetical protein